jgi:hypothetical protein
MRNFSALNEPPVAPVCCETVFSEIPCLINRRQVQRIRRKDKGITVQRVAKPSMTDVRRAFQLIADWPVVSVSSLTFQSRPLAFTCTLDTCTCHSARRASMYWRTTRVCALLLFDLDEASHMGPIPKQSSDKALVALQSPTCSQLQGPYTKPLGYRKC